MGKRKKILDIVSDLVGEFLYYGRKECEDFPVGAIEKAVKKGKISSDEIIDEFSRQVKVAMDETEPKHPMQPMYQDGGGVIRFKPNKIIDELFTGDNKIIDLNELVSRFSGDEYAEDYEQITQLIGYSVSGYGGLSTTTKTNCRRGDHGAEEFMKMKESSE